MDLNSLVDKLQHIADPTVQHLLQIYTRQAMIEGGVDMTMGRIALGLAALFTLGFLVATYMAAADPTMREDCYILAVGLFVLAGLLGVLGAVFFIEGYMHTLNPEYYAVKDLVQSFRR